MSDSSLVNLFKEQLENESQKIADDYGLARRGDALIWWYFLKLNSFSPELIQEAVTDGSGDLGIDAIHIDESNLVHFYQFKNPEKLEPPVKGGDIDKLISGLRLVLEKNHKNIANDNLSGKIEEIYQIVPAGYRIHIVSSGGGISPESEAKLNSFIESIGGPSDEFLTWSVEDISHLQDEFYQKNLPTVDEIIKFEIIRGAPYQVRSSDHDCYMFHSDGARIAELYEYHGEQLLQQNIRVYRGDKSTNAAIRKTCEGEESANFFHYNNGITFLCENAQWDQFTGTMSLNKAQIVNGGQTARVLHRSRKEEKLKPDVVVPIRVITSQGDKEFASNVAVNLNNQNKVETSFLRSNHPNIIQLANSLASLGWFLERREDELKGLTEAEKSQIEYKIGHPLAGRVIRLKEGAQAYVATYFRQPELAKKNSKLIFVGASDGGYFERIFDSNITAEKILYAQSIKWHIDSYVKRFGAIKRKKAKNPNWESEYREFFGDLLSDKYISLLDQFVPQSTIFLLSVIFENEIVIKETSIEDLLENLDADSDEVINRVIQIILDFSHDNKDVANKAWPTLLKSQSFFSHISSYLRGLNS